MTSLTALDEAKKFVLALETYRASCRRQGLWSESDEKLWQGTSHLRDALDAPYIGPIQHDGSMCQKGACVCWCQPCERHNWRHQQVPEALVAALEREGVVTWADGGHRARFLATQVKP